MLSYEELRHFADHGWVLREGMLSQDQCARYVDELDHLVRTRRPYEQTVDTTRVANLTLYDDAFIEWLKLPGILDANRQLVGSALHLESTDAHVKIPHPDRGTRSDELRNPDSWGWHRGLRPKWGTVSADDDDTLINSTFVNNICYLTPVSQGCGATAILDGSHRLEGDYDSLKDRCPILEPGADAGSVLFFTETLIHSAVPILCERTRYNMYYGFTPPWYITWPGFGCPDEIVENLADEELRQLLGPGTYGNGTQFPQVPSVASVSSGE